MSRLQLALNVTDLEESVAFYTRLFGAAPAKVEPGYANFAVQDPPLKLVLIESATSAGGTLNHLGVEHADAAAVVATQGRLTGSGLSSTPLGDQTCCYANQTKFWVQDAPDGEPWEVYTVLADSPTATGEAGKETACCT